MSFFKKSPEPTDAKRPPETTEAKPMIRESTNRPVPPTGDHNISTIAPGMHIAGDLVTNGTIRIEGQVEGTIRAARSVIVGPGGEVVGDIVTQEAVIGGRVVGTVQADSRLELQSTAVIEGEIRARAQHLQLEEGACFNGHVRMLAAEEPMRALPAEVSTHSSREKISTGVVDAV
jgi:cytoskeletal protein CcmA (bactofilin family)